MEDASYRTAGGVAENTARFRRVTSPIPGNNAMHFE